MKNIKYVFIHGLSGWGSYDENHKWMPYWGMRNGDLMEFLAKRGYDSYAASVSPNGSAWDRSCELYAQITGTVTDYGEVHSRENSHGRFGKDYSERALVPDWDDDSVLVLIGHSFGGTTARLFADLMENGCEEERKATPESELSPLFRGGMTGRIRSIVTLASPINGTSAYDISRDPDFDPKTVKAPWWSNVLSRLTSGRLKTGRYDRERKDYADYEMHIDQARRLNERIRTLPGIYYFSVPFSSTKKQKDGIYRPVRMEPFLVKSSCKLGVYKGFTREGTPVDEKWRENDGLVNTFSEKAPFNAPSKPFERENIPKGIWNVFPVKEGDHMWPQGGMLHKHDIADFYLDLLGMINALS